MRINSKGQVTIPKNIRQLLDLTPSSEIEFIIKENNRVYLQKVRPKELENRFAVLRGAGTEKMSTEEIMSLTRNG